MEDGRQFMPMYFDFVESKAFSTISGNSLKLYLRMRRYICRARSGHSLTDFYLKGCLATSGYLEQYANIFGVSKSTISRWLSELEDARFIITYRKAEKGRNEPNIWLFGSVTHYEGSQYGTEAFFADHEAMAQDQDARVPEVFDSSKGQAMIASMKAANLTVSYLEQSTERPTEHPAERLAEPSNREVIIDKSNTEEEYPPSAETSQPNIPIKEDPPFVKRPAAADPIKEKHRAGTRAALARFFETGGNNNFADTAAAGGKSDWDDCVEAFLEVTGQVKPEKTKASWARKFEQIGTEWEAGPAVMAAVIRKKPDSEIGWKSWTEPFSKGVQGDLSFLLGQHFNGGILPPKATGRAARSQLPDALEESRKRRIEVIDVEYAL